MTDKLFFFFSFYRKLLSHLVSVSLWRAGQRWSTTLSGSPWYYSIIVWGEIVFFSQPNPNKNSNIFTIKSKVTKTLKMLPWGDRVTVYLVERDMPSQSHEGTGEEYRCIIHSHTLYVGTKDGIPQTTNLVVFYHLKGQLGPPWLTSREWQMSHDRFCIGVILTSQFPWDGSSTWS